MSTETTYQDPANSYDGSRRRNHNAGFGVATGTGGEKPIPHNTEAEEAVIGALLIDRDTIIKVAPMLRAADFFSEETRRDFTKLLSICTNSARLAT